MRSGGPRNSGYDMDNLARLFDKSAAEMGRHCDYVQWECCWNGKTLWLYYKLDVATL